MNTHFRYLFQFEVKYQYLICSLEVLNLKSKQNRTLNFISVIQLEIFFTSSKKLLIHTYQLVLRKYERSSGRKLGWVGANERVGLRPGYRW